MSSEVKAQPTKAETRKGLLKPGDLLAGRFRIEKMLAEGGMGIVYVAIQEPIGRKVALKVMKDELVSDTASVKRFYREAVAVSKLHHPNTITIIDYGEGEGKKLYIAMEFLIGESLSDVIEREGGLPLKRAVNIIGQVARSLAEAHEKGVIHRDLKPDNIFISTVDGGEDFVKVLDFGIAKLQQQSDGETKITRMGYVCGTPEYMSPEQARGEDLDGRTDLYALGVMLWELLEGTTPYHASTPLGIVLKHQSEPVPPLTANVPEGVKAFVYQAMSKDASERPASSEAFLDELLAVCPDNMEAYSAASAGSRSSSRQSSLSGAPDTPSAPLRQTIGGGVAFAPTMADEEYISLSSTEIPAQGPPRKMGLIIAAAVVVLLVGLAGAAVAMMVGEDGDDVDPVAVTDAVDETAPSVLSISGTPEGAVVFRDGYELGAAPIEISGDADELVRLTIKKDGYDQANIMRKLPESGKVMLAYMLSEEKANPQVVIEIKSDPEGAQIMQGGAVLGNTPHKFKLDKDTSPFAVAVILDDYEEKETQIDPGMGSRTLTIPLEAKKEAPRVRVGKKPGDRATNRRRKASQTAVAKKDPPKVDAVKKDPVKKDPPKKDKYKIVH